MRACLPSTLSSQIVPSRIACRAPNRRRRKPARQRVRDKAACDEAVRASRIPSAKTRLLQKERSKLDSEVLRRDIHEPDRKSTRLNSSHLGISYAVFCLKKKKN